MKRYVKWELGFLILVLWIGFIFYFSHQPATISSQQSYKVVKKVQPVVKSIVSKSNLKAINPYYLTIGFLYHIIRNMAHFNLYFILGILLNLVLHLGKRYILLVGFLLALLDEVHQLFIRGRAMQLSDLAIDFSAILIVTFIMYVLNKIKARIAAGK